jgi:hypothetical protein
VPGHLTHFTETDATPMNTTAVDALLPACAYGAYPWDDWERMALASGLAADLANLGRAVMREAYNHAWCGRLRKECGWGDEGRAMLARVTALPRRTAGRLEWLLATDGLRFDPWQRQMFRPEHIRLAWGRIVSEGWVG